MEPKDIEKILAEPDGMQPFAKLAISTTGSVGAGRAGPLRFVSRTASANANQGPRALDGDKFQITPGRSEHPNTSHPRKEN